MTLSGVRSGVWGEVRFGIGEGQSRGIRRKIFILPSKDLKTVHNPRYLFYLSRTHTTPDIYSTFCRHVLMRVTTRGQLSRRTVTIPLQSILSYYRGTRGVRGYEGCPGVRGCGIRVGVRGYQSRGTRVLEPGYEGISSGVRGYQFWGTLQLFLK